MVATSYRQWTQVNVRQTYVICAITRVTASERAFKIRFLDMFKNLPAMIWSLRSGRWWQVNVRPPCGRRAIENVVANCPQVNAHPSGKMWVSGAGYSVKLVVSGAAFWPAITQERSPNASCSGWPWATTKLVEDNKMLKMMISGTAKTLKWRCSGPEHKIHSRRGFSVACENDLLWSGNLGLKTV